MATLRFDSDSEAVMHLRDTDAVLCRLIDAVGTIELDPRVNRFATLARAIVGQQLSVAAARTIWERFVHLAGEVDAESVVKLDEASMRRVGLSRAKAAYVRDLAVRVLDGTVELDKFDSMPDEKIIEELTSVKGIGRWTAEMFLIFSLGRPDVFAVDDAGLRRAMVLAYPSSPVATTDLLEIAEKWRPFRSVAALVLWEGLDTGVLSG